MTQNTIVTLADMKARRSLSSLVMTILLPA